MAGSAGAAVNQSTLRDEFIDPQYARASSSAAVYVRERWRNYQDLIACYLSLRIADRKEFYDNLTDIEQTRLDHEIHRIEKVRQQFVSWESKRELMTELEKYKTEWKVEARKSLEIFRRQNKELLQELEGQPRRTVHKYRRYIQYVQELHENEYNIGAALGSRAEDEFVKCQNYIREKIRRDEARIERLQCWGMSTSSSIGLPPGHSGFRKVSKSPSKKSKDHTTQRQPARAPMISPTKPWEGKAEPKPLFGLNASAIYFQREVASGSFVGCDHPNTRLRGQFPNQKVFIDDILNEEKNNLLMERCPENGIRYFHFPANNMSWIEVIITNLRPRSGLPY